MNSKTYRFIYSLTVQGQEVKATFIAKSLGHANAMLEKWIKTNLKHSSSADILDVHRTPLLRSTYISGK